VRRSLAACLLVAIAGAGVSCRAAEPVMLVHAFAHNDYQHPRPLTTALECGFGAVEADIFLVDGQLLVAHDRDQVRPERTLEALYLDPLRERVHANGGVVYRGSIEPLRLFIDFKSPAATMYPTLRQTLERYNDMLTSWEADGVHERAVTVVLTGGRPSVDEVAREQVRRVALDGHMTDDRDSDAPAAVMPELSGEWKTMFQWDGRGAMPADERGKLRALVERVHAKGRRLRLWGAPDNAATWSELLAAGVDRINTDDLSGLRDFLLHNGSH
jgi:Glycerophosphoryl diester phosphodiesterase family